MGKSKTNSSTKGARKLCNKCGNNVEVIMSVSSTGKKRLKRLCCET